VSIEKITLFHKVNILNLRGLTDCIKKGDFMKKEFLVVLGLLLLVPVAMAADPSTAATAGDTKGRFLTIAATVAKCRVQFAKGVIDSVKTSLPTADADLTAKVSKIQADLTQLDTVAQGSPEAYKEYLKTNINPDVKSATDALRAQGPKLRGDAVRTAAPKIRADFQKHKADFDKCTFDAHKDFGNAKVNAYEVQIRNHQRKADALKDKGMDTTDLNAIIAGATTEIVTPLKAAIAAATDGKTLSEALHKYCLYDGCKEGTNYHLDAKYEIERLTLVLNYYKTQWSLTVGQVASVETKLDLAKTALDEVGTAQYTSVQQKNVWNNIKEAAQTLKALRPGRTPTTSATATPTPEPTVHTTPTETPPTTGTPPTGTPTPTDTPPPTTGGAEI
jgi:hypothetical protein